MAKVSACPKNVTEVDEAFERMGCGRDIYGNKQYLCLPNAKKTSLVEFCYKEVMGIQEKGTCLVVDGENVTTESCVKFSSGCPLANYWNYEFYQYPACQRIDPQYHCFTSDPSCQPESSSNNAVIYILLYGLLVILFFVVLSYFFLRKNKKTYKPRQTNFSVTDEKSDVTSILTGPSDRSEESIKEVDENKSGSEGHTSTQDTDLCLQSEENGKEVREKYWKVDEKNSTEEKDKKILSPSDLFFKTLCELNGSNLQVLCDVVTEINCESMDIKPVNVFQKLSMVLNRLAVIYSSEELRSTSDLQYLFPFLLKVFHDFLHALKTQSNPAEECEIDSTLQDDDTISTFVNRAYDLKKELLDFESKLLAKVSFVNSAEKKTTSEDKCPLKEIRKFLSDLNINIIKSTKTRHADSANRATVLVNLYSRLAILRSLVLYTILCDKRRIQSDTKEISDWISSTQKDETDVLRCITKVTDKNAVFHSVFHLSERKNENVLHLIQMTGFEIPHLEKSFYDRAHTICWVSREHLKLGMFEELDWKITIAYVNSVECNFKLECIEERLIDNVFYLRSVRWPNKYVTMKSSGSCTVVDGKPQSGGQWKMLKLSTSPENNPQCFLSCIDVPGRFLSQKTNIKSRRNKLWTFREEFQPGETS